jgi:putative hydrolase of the HAD superfamily
MTLSPMPQGLPKAILLDLDDTILALSDTSDPCWQSVCQRFATRIFGLTPERLFDSIKESIAWFWGDPQRGGRGRLNLKGARREILAGAFARLGIDAPDIANEIADTYTVERQEALHLFPGAVETLQHLREHGFRLALITNGSSESQRRKIDRFGLTSFFECIVIEGEFGVGKPDERVYRYALDQLNVEPEETWMIGDNLEGDIVTPQRLGITAIWVDRAGQGSPESIPARPDHVVRSLTELIPLLKEHHAAKGLGLDVEVRAALVQRILATLESAAPGSTAQLRGSLAGRGGDAYSDIDVFWEVPDGLFQASVDRIAEILSQAHPVESLRSAPEFQKSDRRRLIFAQFEGMPLFWRADIDVFARSVERDPAYDRDNDAARGDDWSLTHSALMNGIAAVKALLRGREETARQLLVRGFERVGLDIPAESPRGMILELAESVAAMDPTKAGLADRIVALHQQAFAQGEFT